MKSILRMAIIMLAVGDWAVPGNDGTARLEPTLSPPAPSAVTDLSARALTDSAIVLQWTEVRSSNTSIPRYAVRYGPLGKFSWNTASDLLTMGCGAPIVGANTTGGRLHACVVWNLLPNQAYQFQMVAYTGTLNSTAVFGPLSNIAEATTARRLGPFLVSGPTDTTAERGFVETIAVSTYPGFFNGRYPIRGFFNFGALTLTGYVGDSITARAYLLVARP